MNVEPRRTSRVYETEGRSHLVYKGARLIRRREPASRSPLVPVERLRIYIDTSVLGGCFDAEFSTWSNALIRDL